MPIMLRLGALFLICLAPVVGGNLVATQIYDPFLEGAAADLWRVLDPLMVVALGMVIIVALVRKLRLRQGPQDQTITREYLESNATFYFSCALMLALVWNWVGVEAVDPVNTEALIWIFNDAVLPFLSIAAALWMLREASGKN